MLEIDAEERPANDPVTLHGRSGRPDLINATRGGVEYFKVNANGDVIARGNISCAWRLTLDRAILYGVAFCVAVFILRDILQK